MGEQKREAIKFFECSPYQIKRFDKEDTLNLGTKLTGFINKKEGARGGSLYLTHVNGRLVEPQTIWGCPKLKYPYKDQDFEKREWKALEAKSFFISNKWNGTNVLFFKYIDERGKIKVSAKSKGTPSLGNTQFGNFLDLTRETLGLDPKQSISFDNLPPQLRLLSDVSVQSITFELCGFKEPHLVKYTFPIALQPLFLTYYDGSIQPIPIHHENETRPSPFVYDDVVKMCNEFQQIDFERNTKYREENGLDSKYEYNHFIIEGRVLYLLNENGRLISRSMYKIKPPDIEEVHWETFDTDIQGRVREAVEKIIERGKKFSEESLREELDMGGKEWGKFGKQVMPYASRLVELIGDQSSESEKGKKGLKKGIPKEKDDKRQLLCLVGLPGSGRATFASELERKGWTIIRDGLDETSALIHKIFTTDPDAKVVIDRYNFTRSARKGWISEAQKVGVIFVRAIHFAANADNCREQLEASKKSKKEKRGNELYLETKNNNTTKEELYSVLEKSNVEHPEKREGFYEVLTISTTYPNEINEDSFSYTKSKEKKIDELTALFEGLNFEK